MPRNVYFSQQAQSEQHLFEDIIIESIKIYGTEVYYLPRTIINRDMILNEDHESQFDDAYMVEMYIDNIDGFEGEGNLMQKFGLEIRDEATFVVARRTWEKLVGFWNNTIGSSRPMEGDLIYLPLSNSFFEISFVEHEQPFYQLANLPVYKLQARLFEYNDEDFNTGVDVIDRVETEHADIITILVHPGIGDIDIGLRLYQVLERDDNGDATKWISGEVVDKEYVGDNPNNVNIYLADLEVNDPDLSYFYESTFGDTNTYLLDNVDNAEVTITAEVVEIYDIDNRTTDLTFQNDDSAQNYAFEQDADAIIDFSELNPFGEPGHAIPVEDTDGGSTTPGGGVSVTSATFDSTAITIDSSTLTIDKDS